MSRQLNNFPFPAAKTMSDLMERIRRPTWTLPVDAKMMDKMGIASNNQAKPVAALRFLELIDETGMPTSRLRELQQNYKETLRKVIREKYSELFAIYAPEEMTRARLERYFGAPTQVNERRARFFSWLCKEAGIELPNLAYREENEKKKKKKHQKSSGIPKRRNDSDENIA